MTEIQTNRETHKRPNFIRRRIGAAALAVGLISGAAYMAADAQDRISGTDIPSLNEVAKHPDKYVERKIQPNETLEGIAKEYTTGNHDFRNNSAVLGDQIGKPSVVPAGETIHVPVDTVPPEDR